MAKDPTQGPVSRYDEMNQPAPVGQRLIDGRDLKAELVGRSVPQLKQMAAKLKIPKYSRMRKVTLVNVILEYYGFRTMKIPIPHPPMVAGDLAEPAPEGVSARVRRIREASGQ